MNLKRKEKENKKKKNKKEKQKHKEDGDSGGGGIFGWIFGSKQEKPQQPLPQPQQHPQHQHKQPKLDNVTYDEVLNQISEKDKAQIRIIRQLLDSYFTIVKKNIQDRTTKIIMMSLVKNSISNIQKSLVSNIYNNIKDNSINNKNILDDMLMEAGDVAMKRSVCQEELEALRKAKKVLQTTEAAQHLTL